MSNTCPIFIRPTRDLTFSLLLLGIAASVFFITNPMPLAHADGDSSFTINNVTYSGSGGQNVTYSVIGIHNSTPDTVHCNPSSGSLFPLGNTTVSCYAVDPQGSLVGSASFVVTVTGDITPPSIKAPPNMTVASSGTVTPVNLGNAIVNDDIDPSPIVFNDAPAGGFRNGTTTVTWTAVDHSGNQASAQQTVTVTTTAPPAVQITSPANNVQVTAGTVTFAGTASSGAGVAKVELTIDGNATAYQTATPKAAGDWSTWSIGYNIPVGSHWLVARVTDNMGKQAWNSITVVASASSAPPAVQITSPANNVQVTAGTVTFAGTASSGAGVAKVELTIDGNATAYQTATPKAAGDWSTWSIGYNIPVGSHTITARITDNAAKQQSNSITVAASSAPPAVQITSPANNVQVTAGTVTFAGTASSGAGVAKVELTIDGNATAYQTATPKAAGDWSTWSIGYNIPVGSHWLVARVTDNMGKQAWNSITVVASASSAPPAVQITSPANNAQVTAGTVTFAGTASSGAGVAKVELTIDGNATAYQTATPKAAGDWSTWSIGYNIPVGSHWLVARVTDNMGKQAWNSITVVASASSAPPAVQITSPANNAQVTAGTVTFAGTASSGAGVAKVELTIDGNATAYQTATPKAAGDWSTWSIGYNIPVGSHWLVARVTDNMGKQAWNSITVVGK